MLTMTPAAGMAIRTLTEREGATADGGLRIEALAPENDQPKFGMSFAPMPDELDQVVRDDATGARVMLDSLTAEQVSDFVLDVDDTLDGTAQFRLKPAK
ncbi:Fe-S cluster assembly iron-binding protein IscA [Kibdelosporangium banguiense]|uniref:Fe-S cluster assembly iron-binding protein IscA n=1 Tax=Kibdelosporangium banguiense TaxID=1365924 RepID=A0ABS4TRE3_9PSEU|nr:hypothetical protein [Kibdelosporangium banguiense]MBP2326985.1 Fe-S cluster assembly iron-binding protein IscA [Kibdelosporangium banguiense]